MKKYFLKFISCFILTLPIFVFAQTITLYEQPNASSKPVSTADLATGIIPIYTPKTGDWIKIADPRNGNVGWVKTSDLKNKPGQSSAVFTQKIITNGQAQPTNDQQTQELIKRAQIQQQKMQERLKAISKEMGELLQQQWINVDNMLPLLPGQPIPNQAEREKLMQKQQQQTK